jgi:hypothetical protein
VALAEYAQLDPGDRRCVVGTVTEPTEYPIQLPVTPKMADRMRAAGWREPPRSLASLHELNTAPLLTVVISEQGGIWEKIAGGWASMGSPAAFASTDIALPATVIWEPSE